MKKNIIITVVSVVTGIVLALLVTVTMDMYNLRNMVVNDNQTLSQVVTFLNNTIASQQAASVKK